MFVGTVTEAIMPTDQDTQIARTSSAALGPLLQDKDTCGAHILVRTGSEGETDIVLPLSVVHVLLHALQEMAKGNAVTLLPVETELTTQQAAELLRVSRPSVIKMLDEKKLPYRKVGAHRRIRYEDILSYVEQERRARKEVLKELIAEQERLGLYE